MAVGFLLAPGASAQEGLGEGDLTWQTGSLLIIGAILLVFAVILSRLYLLNRSLKNEIRERRALEERLQAMVRHDPGTGLLNRRGFFEAAAHEVSRGERNNSPMCLMVLDLDRFKEINDQYGHACGDEVLTSFAGICKTSTRDIDVVARTGGEEFLILLPDTVLEGAVLVAERIRLATEASSIDVDDGHKVNVTVSVGVAERLRNESMDLLIARADRSMYRAKEQGRNRVVIANMPDS